MSKNWFEKEMDTLDRQLSAGMISQKDYNDEMRELRYELAEARRDHVDRMMEAYDEYC